MSIWTSIEPGTSLNDVATTIYTAVVDTQRDAAVDSVSHLLQQQLDKYKKA